jgi:hypothetical protein
VSDPLGSIEILSRDWSRVERYRFASGTADYLICKTCGVYIGAACESGNGLRAVTNVNSLVDRAAFPVASSFPDHDEETTAARQARRRANWTPAVLHSAARISAS